MAQFGSYFGLCPLIDHRSLLGVSKDSDEDKVLVTLGRNIAMQYKLADQKQILSWTTKEKFTSPVIFDHEIGKYVAVFNQMYIRCWDYKILNLDKVKKMKFKMIIDTMIVVDNTSFIIFQTGTIVKLTEALENHKSLKPENILGDSEYISDIISCTHKGNKYIGLLVKTPDTTSHLIWTVFDTNGHKAEYVRLKLLKKSCDLVGCAFHISNQEVQLLTLWSDGKLFVKLLENNSDDLGELFSIIESISSKDPVSMVSLDKDYIAMYGANSNQEGALLIIYNMQFKVTQCKQPFKLLTIGAKLWASQKLLILPVGQNLAVVPYNLEKEQLSALVGSHKINDIKNTGKDIIIVQNLEEVTWNEQKEIQENKDKMELMEFAKDYLEQGFPESIIFQEIVPKYIENNNIKCLELFLKLFDDIPEKSIVGLLKYFLEAPRKVFKKSKLVSNDSYPENLQPFKKYEILVAILKKPINEIALIPFFRAMLDLKDVLNFLSFILYLLVDDDNTHDINFMNKLIDWICLTLDANYQTFLLSKDENVLKILLSFTDLVKNELSCLEDLQNLRSFIEQFSKKQKIRKIVDKKNYTVEKIDLS